MGTLPTHEYFFRASASPPGRSRIASRDRVRPGFVERARVASRRRCALTLGVRGRGIGNGVTCPIPPTLNYTTLGVVEFVEHVTEA